MFDLLITILQTLNQLLAAGIAITAFSLLLYALAFNLRDRVARSFAVILLCVVIVFVCDAIGSVAQTSQALEFWLRLQWVGIAFLPPAYLHLSDALLATTGSSTPRAWRWFIRSTYVISTGFLATLPFSLLAGPLVPYGEPAPHLQRTLLTWVFTVYYIAVMLWAAASFWRAYRRTVTATGQRRMRYLLLGALAPALGSYQYLLFGSWLTSHHPVIFWMLAVISNLFVSILLALMAYATAFFGVSWPDRVVRRRLFKWLLRGPITASVVLGTTTLVRRVGERFGVIYSALVPIVMVASLLILEYIITLTAPWVERWLLHGSDRGSIQVLQALQERLLTTGDLRQFLEAVVAAVCDRMQVRRAFVAALGPQGLEMLVTLPGDTIEEDLSSGLLQLASDAPQESVSTGSSLRESVQKLQKFRQLGYNDTHRELFAWGNYWLVPLFGESDDEERLLGLLGVWRLPDQSLEEEQRNALTLLAHRAALALEDRAIQQRVFSSLEALTPQVELLQRMRAAGRYGGSSILTTPPPALEESNVNRWVKDALTHFWGGPRLTESPLLQLKVVQQATLEHEDNPANALRAVLRAAIEQIRPEGDRRFTGEWILYNLLEMKFMEGHKVRDIAQRLALSEADLYRKQRVAIEAVADAILEMEQRALQEQPPSSNIPPTVANFDQYEG